MPAAVFWPTFLGCATLIVGLVTYRRDRGALGVVFVAAGLAAFAGEHFTAARDLAQLVPRWMPARVFIAYFVGVAHLAAATSFVARRYVRWSSLWLAIMFALFVLLMDLPGALAHPAVRINWSLAAREATYSIGALALFAVASVERWPDASRTIAGFARAWTAGVLVFYGIENVLYPQYSPGVPDMSPTAAWIPMPAIIAYVTGILLIIFGAGMVAERRAAAGAAAAGWLMIVLTAVLYAPQLFLAQTVSDRVNAINFIFDTMLFGGTLLVISHVLRAMPRRGEALRG